MSINDVTAGDRCPQEFNVIIEIPMNADPSSTKWTRKRERCSWTVS